ncbi:uncharacterized protein LOC101163910 [Oryzias latipes]|uniref:Fork-head domain-containing protein n=1 Tax=Oryzias latipes TaxID=8090 RepID=A0A3B3HIF8_ORYLA|nr:uncharacterized protein LOC101163910 [Oryzias latipes]
MEKSGVPGTFHPTSGTRREVYGNASTYLAKIAVALHDAPDQMLTFTQLIQKMEPLISEGRKSVENNIRVCLSTHRCFRKIPVVPDPVTTKRNYWKLDSSQITTKMVRRHLKDLLHLFPELASKVETGSKNQRSGKQSVLCSPQPAACDDARVNGKFSSSFSIENLLKKDTTPARPLRAFPPSILLVKAEQHLCSDHRSAGEKTAVTWGSEQLLFSQTPAGSFTFWSTGGSISHCLNTGGMSQSIYDMPVILGSPSNY